MSAVALTAVLLIKFDKIKFTKISSMKNKTLYIIAAVLIILFVLSNAMNIKNHFITNSTQADNLHASLGDYDLSSMRSR